MHPTNTCKPLWVRQLRSENPVCLHGLHLMRGCSQACQSLDWLKIECNRQVGTLAGILQFLEADQQTMPSRRLPGLQSVSKPGSLRGQPRKQILQKHCSSVFSCMLVLWKVQVPRARGPNLSVTGRRLLHPQNCYPALVQSRSDTVQEHNGHTASYPSFQDQRSRTSLVDLPVLRVLWLLQFSHLLIWLTIASSLSCLPYRDHKQEPPEP